MLVISAGMGSGVEKFSRVTVLTDLPAIDAGKEVTTIIRIWLEDTMLSETLELSSLRGSCLSKVAGCIADDIFDMLVFFMVTITLILVVCHASSFGRIEVLSFRASMLNGNGIEANIELLTISLNWYVGPLFLFGAQVLEEK